MASASKMPFSSVLDIAPTLNCVNCGKIQQDGEKPLKKCAKCLSVHYCDRGCQKGRFVTPRFDRISC